MRDCIFLLADKNMEAAFTGFLTRDGFHLSLGIRRFAFDQTQDIIVESGSDPGVFHRAHKLLRLYLHTHRFAVIGLDHAWDGSPDVEVIEQTIMGNMLSSGWHADSVVVIVIDPELETWLWQDSPHVATALRFTQHLSLRQWLESQGLWDTATAKPSDPKRAVEVTLRISRTPRSSAIYRQITHRISVQACSDPAFVKLRATLRQWFPIEDQP